jgi:hypothetical protein
MSYTAPAQRNLNINMFIYEPHASFASPVWSQLQLAHHILKADQVPDVY